MKAISVLGIYIFNAVINQFFFKSMLWTTNKFRC